MLPVNNDKNICRTKRLALKGTGAEKGMTMVDTKALAEELHQARLARLEAEAANSDLEELLWEVQHMPADRRCFAYFFAGVDEDVATH